MSKEAAGTEKFKERTSMRRKAPGVSGEGERRPDVDGLNLATGGITKHTGMASSLMLPKTQEKQKSAALPPYYSSRCRLPLSLQDAPQRLSFCGDCRSEPLFRHLSDGTVVFIHTFH